MAIISGNFWLNSAQMENNASILWPAMQALGWSDWAIAGIMGNMQTESTLNPGIWQGLNEGNEEGGYGLVQWTPATNFLNWAEAQGYDPEGYEGQLQRMVWEYQNGEQYYSTNAYPLSFDEFLHYQPSNDETDEEACKYLADAFIKNYERPENQNQPQRGEQAWRWFQIFHDNVPDPPEPEPPEPPDPPKPDEPGNEYKYLWECGGVFWILIRSDSMPYVLSSTVRRVSRDIVEYQGVQFKAIGGNYYKAVRGGN